METLGLVICIVTLSAIIWAIIQNGFFAAKVLINRDKYDEKARKRTIILFLISVLSAAALIFLCALFARVSDVAAKFLIYLLLFFALVPVAIFLFILVEIMISFFSVFFCRGKFAENIQKAVIVPIPIAALYFGVSVIISFCFQEFFNYMPV